MANAHVEEFRSAVESVIQKQVDEAGNVSWLTKHTTASVDHLIFGSYAKGDSRPHTFFLCLPTKAVVLNMSGE